MSRLSVGNTVRWRTVRDLVIQRDGQCEDCGATENLSADHIVPLSRFTPEDWEAEREYDLDNLRCLCWTCNARRSDRVDVRVTWVNRKWLDSSS